MEAGTFSGEQMRQPGWTVGLPTRYQVLQGEPVVWALLLYPGLVGFEDQNYSDCQTAVMVVGYSLSERWA